MERNERLLAAFNHLRMKGFLKSQKDLADALGATAPHISSALNGNEKYLTDNLLIRFQSKYNQFNLEWLMSGTGEMLNETSNQSNDILSRIKHLIELSGLSYADFAKKVGITTSDFEKKLEGTMDFNDDDIMQISEALNVRIGWLYKGEGQMLNAPDKMRKQAIVDSYRVQACDESIKGIPLIPTNAMAGSLTGDSVQIMPYDIESYFIVPAFAKSDFCIRVDGKSMEPTYCKGDIIACKYVPMADIWFQWGKVYVIATDQGVLVKHIEKGSDDEHIKLVSDNPEYMPFEIPTSGIYNIAVINGLIRVGDI